MLGRALSVQPVFYVVETDREIMTFFCIYSRSLPVLLLWLKSRVNSSKPGIVLGRLIDSCFIAKRARPPAHIPLAEEMMHKFSVHSRSYIEHRISR